MVYPKFIRKTYKACANFIKRSRKLKTLKIPYAEPKNTYKKLICLQGFGHSGSGALLDLLAEFDNLTVIGYHDFNGGATELNNNKCCEFDFLRIKGGIFDLMSAFTINQNNFWLADCKLKDFITMSEYNYRQYGGFYNDKYMELTNEFINKLVDYTDETEYGLDSNFAFRFDKALYQKDYVNLRTPYEFHNIKPRYRYFLKNLSGDEYLEIAKEYVTSLLKTIESKEYLVLDQFLSDYCANFDLYKKVVGDYRLIAVYRDPRDVYATGILLKEPWIPKDKETFVKWYSKLVKPYIGKSSKNFMMIRFEDLILQNESTTQKVADFLGIDISHHVNKQKYLITEKSSKNIGIYKKLTEHSEQIKYIEDQLKEYCYQ